MRHAASVHRATCGRLAVEICPHRSALGRTAARACAATLQAVLAERDEARIILGGDPSQAEFLTALADPRQARVAVDWSRVTVFHLSEYVGLPATAPQSCRCHLARLLLHRVPVGRFHGIAAEQADLAAVCARYAALLGAAPIDLVCLGIGENGHLAFNDPPAADFEDRESIKPVELDTPCRQQQVNDGIFPHLAAVPRHALTLTLPVFRRALRLSVQTPGARRAPAVRTALHDAITTACPATILRLHPAATLYLDPPSAALAFPEHAPPTPARHPNLP